MGAESSVFSNDTKRTLVVSVAIAAVLIGVYAIFHSKPEKSPTNTIKRVEIAAVTPLSYTAISGKITALDLEKKTIQVDFLHFDQSGKTSTKSYTVSISDTTSLQAVNQSVAEATTSPISLADLAIGNTVSAVSDIELANITAFTATTILRTK